MCTSLKAIIRPVAHRVVQPLSLLHFGRSQLLLPCTLYSQSHLSPSQECRLILNLLKLGEQESHDTSTLR